jgi:hypothetical protein
MHATNAHSFIPTGAGGHVVLTGDVMRTFSDVLTGFRAGVVRLLRSVGLIDDAQLYAMAFCRLEHELFRLPWVEGVVTRGVARRTGDHRRRTGADVEVVSLDPPDDAMRREVDELVVRVNRRFGVGLSGHVVGWKRLNTGLRPGDAI